VASGPGLPASAGTDSSRCRRGQGHASGRLGVCRVRCLPDGRSSHGGTSQAAFAEGVLLDARNPRSRLMVDGDASNLLRRGTHWHLGALWAHLH